MFIYKTAWTILAILILFGIGYAFYPPIRHFHELQVKETRLQEQIRTEEETLRHIQQKEERLLNDPRFVEKIAREELGLAKPGETVFKFVDSPAADGANTGHVAKSQKSIP